MDEDHERALQRIIDQGNKDRSEFHDREQEREYQRGKREAEVDARLYDHEQHLRRINGSIETYTKSLNNLTAQMSKLEKTYATSTAVAAAIAEKAVSTRTFIFGVLTLLVPIVVLVITLITHLHR